MANNERPRSVATGIARQEAEEGAVEQIRALEGRVTELDMRLRERIEESLVLDDEVRSLQAELDVRQGFVIDLEQRVTALSAAHHEFASLQAELNRSGHRIVCAIYLRANRFPRLYRGARVLCRAIARSV